MKLLPIPMILLFGALSVTPFGAGQDKPPAPKWPLGKDTTYVTGPLDKNGYIDYESALNAELSRGITPDKNANVLLIQAFGPAPEGGDGLPPAYFKWLGIPAPPREGQYLIGISAFARNQLALTNDQLQALYDQQGWATRRPWTARDYPALAEWLKANEKPLALVLEGTKRPAYFNPLVSRTKDDERGLLIGALLPSVQKCREIASCLTARAMLRVGEGRFDEAWADLIACHRLARLVSRGGTLIEGLVAIAISHVATDSTLAYLEAAPLDGKQLSGRIRELQGLPAFKPIGELIGLGERFMGLDSLQAVRGRGLGAMETFSDRPTPKKLTAEELKALDSIDWAPGLRAMNQWYDRLAAATRHPDRATREKAFGELEKELLARKRQLDGPANLGRLLLGKDNQTENASRIITEVLIGLLTPAVAKVQGAYDRATQTEQNLLLAFALAAYRADHGQYPAKLADLAPKYLPAVADDVFSGRPLIYKPTATGYLLYSVGLNGKDDGGGSSSDDPPGDDLAVRMPLPPLRKR